MGIAKTKTIENIEQKMEGVGQDTVRYQVLQNAKNFKTSWIGLGQSLYTVWKDKLYKEWGYNTFDAYTKKEIGIRKETALKLLRSYYFLEKDDPRVLRPEFSEDTSASKVPTYESIDALRLAAKKKLLDESDYARIKKSVFEDGKDAREIKKDLTALMKEREELEPEEAWKKKKVSLIKRFLGTLKAVSRELKATKMLSAQVIKDADSLIKKLEDELS